MKRSRMAALLLCCAAALLLWRCSFSVAGGGGTETGNPQAVACAAAAFDAMESGDQWRPIFYVPGGQARLDPQSINLAAPTYGIAKAAAAPDTFICSSETLYLLDTVEVRDTVYRPETTFVKDTVTRVRMVSDTVNSVSAGDTSSLVYTRRVTDTMVVIDTLIGVDTIIYVDSVVVRDTLYPGDTVVVDPDRLKSRPWALTPRADMAAVGGTITYQPAVAYNAITMNDSGPAYEFLSYTAPVGQRTVYAQVPAANYSTTSLSALTSVEKRWTSASGASAIERYADLDGDGLLLSAAAPAVPQVRFTVLAADQRRSQQVEADFDGGADKAVTSPADNRLLRLARLTLSPDSTQRVGWNQPGAGLSDSVLSVSTFLNRGEAESLTVCFAFSKGADPVSWDDDLLRSISVAKVFRSGKVARLDMTVTLAVPVGRGQAPSLGSVTATVHMTDGTVYAVTDGVVDRGKGRFGATYVKDGSSGTRIDTDRSELP